MNPGCARGSRFTSTLDEWIEVLADVGIQPWKIVPEDYGLARIPGTMSILVDGDESSLTTAPMSSSVWTAASRAMRWSRPANSPIDRDEDDASVDPTGHLVVYCAAADEERFAHDWIALRHELHSVDINVLPDGALPRLAVTVASGNGVNLLQGRYGPKADYGSWLRPWRTAAVLLLGLVFIGFAGKGVDYYRLTQEEAALRRSSTRNINSSARRYPRGSGPGRRGQFDQARSWHGYRIAGLPRVPARTRSSHAGH